MGGWGGGGQNSRVLSFQLKFGSNCHTHLYQIRNSQIILENLNLFSDFQKKSIHYHVGLNNSAVKNSRKAVYFYTLNANIHSFLISVKKDLKTDWESTELVDSLYWVKSGAELSKQKTKQLLTLNQLLFLLK